MKKINHFLVHLSLLNDWFKKSSVFIMFYKGYPLDTFQAGI